MQREKKPRTVILSEEYTTLPEGCWDIQVYLNESWVPFSALKSDEKCCIKIDNRDDWVSESFDSIAGERIKTIGGSGRPFRLIEKIENEWFAGYR